MYLSVPLPEYLEATATGEAEADARLRRRGRGGRGGRGEEGGMGHPGVSLEECIELFCEEETLEGGKFFYFLLAVLEVCLGVLVGWEMGGRDSMRFYFILFSLAFCFWCFFC